MSPKVLQFYELVWFETGAYLLKMVSFWLPENYFDMYVFTYVKTNINTLSLYILHMRPNIFNLYYIRRPTKKREGYIRVQCPN